MIVPFFLLFKYLIYYIYFCMFTIIKEVKSSNLYYVMDCKNSIKLPHSRNGFMLNQLNSVWELMKNVLHVVFWFLFLAYQTRNLLTKIPFPIEWDKLWILCKVLNKGRHNRNKSSGRRENLLSNKQENILVIWIIRSLGQPKQTTESLKVELTSIWKCLEVIHYYCCLSI